MQSLSLKSTDLSVSNTYMCICCVCPGLQCENRLRAPPPHAGWVWLAAHMCAAHSYHPTRQVDNTHAVSLRMLLKTFLSLIQSALYITPTPVCVCSDGNLATKQVVFLQRPVRGQAAEQLRNQVRGGQERKTDWSDTGSRPSNSGITLHLL